MLQYLYAAFWWAQMIQINPLLTRNLVENYVANNLSVSQPDCRQKVLSFLKNELFCTGPIASYWAKQNFGLYIDFGINNKSSQYWEKAPHHETFLSPLPFKHFLLSSFIQQPSAPRPEKNFWPWTEPLYTHVRGERESIGREDEENAKHILSGVYFWVRKCVKSAALFVASPCGFPLCLRDF